ncbi:hypothetical protein FOH24_08805 [Acetobacter tropicalis]|nr:hypothetical protein [Acetobacter tropicalis]KAA8389638.1 hypothetical protein FOH22_06380 [Acetobacter tropicalis]KAA8390440.1 hypothetical protein FOH24_08805 [Acetobacter tropicalis]MDO8173274.1 hypothetical protein [Acetobacter tropicalis]
MNVNPNLGDMLVKARLSPAAQMLMDINSIESYKDFLIVVYKALEVSIRQVSMQRKHRQNATEDQITAMIVGYFRTQGLTTAVHDPDIGGHVDIAIELDNGYLWLAEAKKWAGCSWIMSGYKQLLTRYATGLNNQDHGALLIYFFEERPQTLMKKWFDQIQNKYKILSNLNKIGSFEFDSTQIHKSTENPYYIRHIGVPLLWRPEK